MEILVNGLVQLNRFNKTTKANVNKRKVSIKDDLLWSLLNKKLVSIDDITKTSTKMTSKTQKLAFLALHPIKLVRNLTKS